MSDWKEVNLSVRDIAFDENLQIRVKLSDERVEEFVEIFDQLPPIRIIKESDTNYLADGFHRYSAAVKKNENSLRCLIRDGTYKEALEIAVKENSKGPMNMSREDKRRAVTKMLTFFPDRANSWIAEDAGVAMQTVDSVRNELEQAGTIKQYEKLFRRDEKSTPRVYTKPEPTVKAEEKKLAPGLDDMSQVEREDLMRLSSRALGRKYDTGSPANTQSISPDALQTIQKAIYKDDATRPIHEQTSSEISFVGDNVGVFAETFGIDKTRGLRAMNRDGNIVINMYETMRDPLKLFPKAGMQLSFEDFGMFVASCVKFFEENKK